MQRYNNRGLSGLVNLGNTCFMNAFIQCLSHTHEFSDFLEKNEKNENPEHVLLNEWNSLRKLMWSKNCTISPKRFVHYVHLVSKEHNKRFQTYSQEDVSEFIFFILELFNDYLKFSKDYVPRCKNPSEVFKKKMFKKEYSPIIELFYGIQVSTIARKDDNTILKEVPEHFSVLTLHLLEEKETTITECIEDYCKKELLDGENQYQISDDNPEKVDATKYVQFYELPTVLIIILKRYSNFMRKRHDSVEIQETLHLDTFAKTSNNNYELFGVNLHSGILGGGHYMAVIKNNKNWYVFNDANINKISFSKIKTNPNVYCLFYRKISK